MTQTAHLETRSLLHLGGADVTDFLQNLITCNVENLSDDEATFGALLTPQGKILFDFFLQRVSSGFLLEVDHSVRDTLAKRLIFYKLRADVFIDLVDDKKVFASWNGDTDSGFADPRLPDLGKRIYASDLETNASESEWNARRIGLGVPQSGSDYDLGEPFPHEVLMDQFSEAGVDFNKGCYVGQEVVSRMHHRGTARSRWVIVTSDGDLPPKGTAVSSGTRSIGTMGSNKGSQGLAVVRLDRVKTAIDDGTPIETDGTMLTVKLPDFVNFEWPQ